MSYKKRPNHDEASLWSEQLAHPSAVADPAFKAELKKRLFASHQRPVYNFTALFMSLFTRRNIIIGSLLTLVLLGGLGWGTVSYLSGRNRLPAISESELLAKMLKNSSPSVFGRSQAGDSTFASAENDKDRLSMLIAPYDRDYTYGYTNTTYHYGPAKDQCRSLTLYMDGIYRTEYLDFVDSSATDQTWRSKVVSYDNKANVVDYSLQVGDKSTYYKGGKYAVTLTNEVRLLLDTRVAGNTVVTDKADSVDSAPAQDAPVEKEPAGEPTLADYFGQGAKLLGEEKIDGKSYYVVQSSFEIGCDPSKFDSRNDRQVSTRMAVDPDTFETVKQDFFLGSSITDQSKLIYGVQLKFEKSNDNWDKVAGKFQFDQKVPVRTVDQDPQKIEVQRQAAVREYVQEQRIPVLRMPGNAYSATSLDVYQATYRIGSEYLFDRDFYANNTVGKRMYEEHLAAFQSLSDGPVQVASLSFESKNQSQTHSVLLYLYGANVTEQELVQSEGELLRQDTIKVTIGTSPVTANWYTQDLEKLREPGNSGGGADSTLPVAPDDRIIQEPCVDDPQGCPVYNVVIFQYQNHWFKAAVWTYQSKAELEKVLKFTTVTTAGELEELFNEIGSGATIMRPDIAY